MRWSPRVLAIDAQGFQNIQVLKRCQEGDSKLILDSIEILIYNP